MATWSCCFLDWLAGDFLLIASLHRDSSHLITQVFVSCGACQHSSGGLGSGLCHVGASQQSSGFRKSSAQHLIGGRCGEAASFLNRCDSGFPASSLALSPDRGSKAPMSASTKTGSCEAVRLAAGRLSCPLGRQARAPHSCGSVGNPCYRPSERASGSMIHQKVLRERSGFQVS